MNIDEFRAELETRLLIEKEYLIQEAPSVDQQERLELLGKFNQKYKELIKRLADEDGIDLQTSYTSEDLSDPENLSYEQVILGKTMSVYDRLSDELYEEITNI
ncbi:hypothetical protein IQ37_17335 [Chryseobacterium piperi]|uniref:Uncharacterized protein n=1 Tax=Chryseobacterium piperi TaxID=558152 RepID=A0A086AK34_9FLAO|nr:hypothetical protein [Chryseobacterium piperi]ASW74831.1 hypothetical protein CJF12_11445 [Chryseobacterium piperi]KFF17048.1 hypothetical protein IQ37_17335 [Chryseobacterium piperi]